MAEEISVTGNKKVETLMKEFNKKYPYLQLCIFPIEAKKIVEGGGGSITPVDRSKTIASVRSKVAPGDVTITGNKKVRTLEKEFEQVFGLYAQVCYYTSDGKGKYTGGDYDNMTLTALNKKIEERGGKKDIWY